MSWRPVKKPEPPRASGGKRAPDSAVTRAELDVLRQKAADLAAQNPEKAAMILSLWIKQAGGHQKKSG